MWGWGKAGRGGAFVVLFSGPGGTRGSFRWLVFQEGTTENKSKDKVLLTTFLSHLPAHHSGLPLMHA